MTESKKATKVTPSPARDILGTCVRGAPMTASEQRWKNRDDQVVMVGFIGSVEDAHRENTSWWKHVTLVMTGTLVVSS